MGCQLQPVPVSLQSTEFALLEVPDSIYTAANNKLVTVPIGLDLLAAFDSKPSCHSTLLERLQSEFGVTGTRTSASLAPVVPIGPARPILPSWVCNQSPPFVELEAGVLGPGSVHQERLFP